MSTQLIFTLTVGLVYASVFTYCLHTDQQRRWLFGFMQFSVGFAFTYVIGRCWDSQGNSQCYADAYNIANLGGLDYIQKYFGGGYTSVDQWLKTALSDPGLDNNFLHPHADPLYQAWCGGAGLSGQAGCGGSHT